ncbi:type II secretion system protein GspG [Spartinivicinus ruber]|uniref:type II secretion system protein GspG n=1 Tax=Spartinivicinus ruber TaxID=2683272 RepID=UPI0013D785FC|nr:type II secretion system protein GspG [Spartinivicinus ruber]
MKKTVIRVCTFLVALIIVGLATKIVVSPSKKELAKVKVAESDVKIISEKLLQYKRLVNNFPNEDGWYLALKSKKGLGDFSTGIGLVNNIPVDPWGNKYIYRRLKSGITFEVISYGADGKAGGTGTAEDIKIVIDK